MPTIGAERTAAATLRITMMVAIECSAMKRRRANMPARVRA
jgi:hypothetical protein